jgi:class 3 adenylate cyclase
MADQFTIRIGRNAYGPVVAGSRIRVETHQTGPPSDEHQTPDSMQINTANEQGTMFTVMDHEPEYRALMAVDVEHSAGRGDMALQTVRDVLFSSLRESFERSGIDWEACLRDDLGDGVRVTAPAGTHKTRLIHPLTHELAVRLRAHNRLAGPLTRIRVRIALHAGDVYIDRAGTITGQPLEVLARMLDAAPARTALANAPETVPSVVLVSQHFYDETVRHGYPGTDPETFHNVTFTVKEYTADAWLHLPLSAIAPEPASTAPLAENPQTTPG